MLTKTKTLMTASIIALTAVPVLAESPRVGKSPEAALSQSENFAVEGTTDVDAPRSTEIAEQTVDVESTNREMGIMQVSDLTDYLRDDMQLTDSPLLGTAVWASDETRVGVISKVYKTPEGDQVAVADIEPTLEASVDQFAVRVPSDATSVMVPMDEFEFSASMKAFDGGGEGR